MKMTSQQLRTIASNVSAAGHLLRSEKLKNDAEELRKLAKELDYKSEFEENTFKLRLFDGEDETVD